jgi:GNAT superfamily N-acetyltransferase
VALDLPLSPDGVERRLRDGSRVILRPIRRDDASHLREGFARMSERSRFLRFFSPLLELPDDLVRRLSDLDHRTHRAWVVFDPDAPGASAPGLGVGVARLVQLPDQATAAEAAFAVTDDYQGRGVGRLLLEVVAGTAAAAGYDTIVTEILRENAPMLSLMRSLGKPVNATADGSTVRIEVALGAVTDEQFTEGALYDLLRLAAGHAGATDDESA